MPQTMATVRQLSDRGVLRPEPRQPRNVGFLVKENAERAMAANAITGEVAINVGNGERIGSFVAGAVLIGRALSRPSVGRIAAAIGGAVLLQRAITGHCGVYEKLGIGGISEKPTRRRRRHHWKDPV